MADQISTLGLAVDTSDVKTAEKQLDAFTAAGDRAATAGEALERAMSDVAPAANAAAAAFSKTAPAVTATQRLATEAENLAKSTKLSAYQSQQLSFQLNDLFVQVASGASPMTALIQQGSQLSGTFGGIGAAARAAGGFVLGFVNPVTVAVGAAAALAIAYEKGAQEAREFQKTLILTGNAAGTTAAALADMARQVNALGAGTVGRAAEVLNQLAQTGQVAASNLTAFTNAALQMERVGGPAVEQTVQAFADLGKAPLQASQRLNESMNYLTRSTYDQVRALELQGRTIEAAQVAQKAYADALNQRTPEMEKNIGLLERAWRAVKEATKGAADAALSVGRPTSDQQRLVELRQQLESSRDYNRNTGSKDPNATKELEDEISLLSRKILREQEVAAAQAATNDKEKAYRDFVQQGDQYLTSQEQLTRALTAARNQAVAAGIDEEALQDRLARIRRQFNPGAGEAIQIAKIDDTKRNLNTLVAAYQDAEQQLEANRQAGLVGDKDYYDAKIGFLKLNAEAQRRILEEDTKAQQVLLKNPALNTSETVAIQTRIKDNLAEISRLQDRTATTGTVIATQQASAQRALAAAYQASRDAAEDYLRTLTRGQQRDIAGFGLGSEERARQSGRFQIADKYDDDRARVQSQISVLLKQQEGELTKEQAESFTNQLNLIAEFKDKSLAEYDAYYAARRKQEADGANGAAEALANYVDSQRNAARSVQDAYEHTFSSIEDTLTQFYKTGKLNAKGLVDTIITELARLEARKVTAQYGSSLASVLGSIFGAAAGSGLTVDTGGYGITPGNGSVDLPTRGGRAIGGPVDASGTYEVNERGIPEIARVGGRDYLTMTGQGGKVTPLDQASAGSNITINVGAGVQRGEIVALIPELTRQIKAAVLADVRSPVRR